MKGGRGGEGALTHLGVPGKKTGSVEKRVVHLVGAVGSDNPGSRVPAFPFLFFF